ncbi:hypothetical protein CAAN1_04S00628 [[Candida] anglica]|uniref:Uncharacterized protein n=1 Tax=[Candida] anglica TaxID=148631 RepID=A0ABP0E994_9ASCO
MIHHISQPIPEAKRRKIVSEVAVRPVTPVSPSPVNLERDDLFMGDDARDAMDTRDDNGVCPCGHLHGQGEHHDISAVGFSSQPLLRGPD